MHLKKLTLTAEKRENSTETAEQRLKRRMVDKLQEQLEIILAEDKGQSWTRTSTVYETDEHGNRTSKTVERRVGRWFWKNTDGKWLLELRYGNRAIDINKGRTAIMVGDRENLAATIDTALEAVKSGELDAALKRAFEKRKQILKR